MIQLKHFCNDWSNDNLEAIQARAERLLGFIIQLQAQYPNVNGTDDSEETVKVILDKEVQGISYLKRPNRALHQSSSANRRERVHLNTKFFNHNLSST